MGAVAPCHGQWSVDGGHDPARGMVVVIRVVSAIQDVIEIKFLKAVVIVIVVVVTHGQAVSEAGRKGRHVAGMGSFLLVPACAKSTVVVLSLIGRERLLWQLNFAWGNIAFPHDFRVDHNGRCLIRLLLSTHRRCRHHRQSRRPLRGTSV